MNPARCQNTFCVVALLATSLLSGCMAQRPHPYNRPSFHASLDQRPSVAVSQAQLARWHRKPDEQLVATATATANAPKELSASPR
jgi:hypothetical protein